MDAQTHREERGTEAVNPRQTVSGDSSENKEIKSALNYLKSQAINESNQLASNLDDKEVETLIKAILVSYQEASKQYQLYKLYIQEKMNEVENDFRFVRNNDTLSEEEKKSTMDALTIQHRDLEALEVAWQDMQEKLTLIGTHLINCHEKEVKLHAIDYDKFGYKRKLDITLIHNCQLKLKHHFKSYEPRIFYINAEKKDENNVLFELCEALEDCIVKLKECPVASGQSVSYSEIRTQQLENEEGSDLDDEEDKVPRSNDQKLRTMIRLFSREDSHIQQLDIKKTQLQADLNKETYDAKKRAMDTYVNKVDDATIAVFQDCLSGIYSYTNHDHMETGKGLLEKILKNNQTNELESLTEAITTIAKIYNQVDALIDKLRLVHKKETAYMDSGKQKYLVQKKPFLWNFREYSFAQILTSTLSSLMFFGLFIIDGAVIFQMTSIALAFIAVDKTAALTKFSWQSSSPGKRWQTFFRQSLWSRTENTGGILKNLLEVIPLVVLGFCNYLNLARALNLTLSVGCTFKLRTGLQLLWKLACFVVYKTTRWLKSKSIQGLILFKGVQSTFDELKKKILQLPKLKNDPLLCHLINKKFRNDTEKQIILENIERRVHFKEQKQMGKSLH